MLKSQSTALTEFLRNSEQFPINERGGGICPPPPNLLGLRLGFATDRGDNDLKKHIIGFQWNRVIDKHYKIHNGFHLINFVISVRLLFLLFKEKIYFIQQKCIEA